MINKLKSKLLTKLFVEWVKNEIDIETLEMSRSMIEQRQNIINPQTDTPTIGFRY